MNWEPQTNLTGVFPTGYDYPRTGLSFDPDRAARSVSYEEYLEERKKAEEEEDKTEDSLVEIISAERVNALYSFFLLGLI